MSRESNRQASPGPSGRGARGQAAQLGVSELIEQLTALLAEEVDLASDAPVEALVGRRRYALVGTQAELDDDSRAVVTLVMGLIRLIHWSDRTRAPLERTSPTSADVHPLVGADDPEPTTAVTYPRCGTGPLRAWACGLQVPSA